MKTFKMPSLRVTDSNVPISNSMENSGFLPSIFKATSGSESDMEALSGSLSPTTRRGSRGSSLTSSPTKLPSIDRSSTNSVSSVTSLTSIASSRHQRRSNLCRSPSCPQLWNNSGDAPEMMSSRELTKFALGNKGAELGLTLPDIRSKKEGKQAKYLAMKREQWLEKQSRKRNSGGTPRKSSSNGDVTDLIISPRNKVQNPVLFPMDTTYNKENEIKKGKKKKLKANKNEKSDIRKIVLNENKTGSGTGKSQQTHGLIVESDISESNKKDKNMQNDTDNIINKVENSKNVTAQNSPAQNDSISCDRSIESNPEVTPASAETPRPKQNSTDPADILL